MDGGLTRIFEQFDHRPILLLHLVNETGIPNRRMEPLDIYRVFQRYGHTSQRTLEIDLGLSPCFRLRKQQFRYTVGLLLGLDGDFAIRAENIDGRLGVLVDVADKVFDGLVDDPLVKGRECRVVSARKGSEAICAFLSLGVAVVC